MIRFMKKRKNAIKTVNKSKLKILLKKQKFLGRIVFVFSKCFIKLNKTSFCLFVVGQWAERAAGNSQVRQLWWGARFLPDPLRCGPRRDQHPGQAGVHHLDPGWLGGRLLDWLTRWNECLHGVDQRGNGDAGQLGPRGAGRGGGRNGVCGRTRGKNGVESAGWLVPEWLWDVEVRHVWRPTGGLHTADRGTHRQCVRLSSGIYHDQGLAKLL